MRLGLRTVAAVELFDGLSQGDVVVLGHAQEGDRVRTHVLAVWPVVVSLPGGGNGGGGGGAALSNAMGR